MSTKEAKQGYGQKIASRSEDFPGWYNDVVLQAELADYSPVRGSMVIRPYGYALWENMQARLDVRFKATGVVNAYFPLLIPESLLQKEADHVEGFAPEVAWVTHGGNEELAERLAIRPTSEAIVMHMYSRWVQSYRDLPLLINQWNNVLRWEVHTRLFLRTAEFLWQEGHTVHASDAEATERTLLMLETYRAFIEEDLAIPVIPGVKSESERFPGAKDTYTVEALMGDGRALQSATSHDFADHFTRAFEIEFLDAEGERRFGATTSWGLSTRTIGGIVMVHGDAKGLILPPRVAPVQVVIVPISRKSEDAAAVREFVETVQRSLGTDLRVQADFSEGKTPGWKFNEWELKGAPVRLEIGPRDVAAQSVVVARRDTGEKQSVGLDALSGSLVALMETMQTGLFESARQFRAENTHEVSSVEEMRTVLDEGRGFMVGGWCGGAACEAYVKEQTRATIRVIPFEQGDAAERVCIVCGSRPARRVYIARAY